MAWNPCKVIYNFHNHFCLQLLTAQTETFGGDSLLTGQDALLLIHKQMDGWTESGLQVFGRHKTEAGENNADHEDMVLLNEVIIFLTL